MAINTRRQYITEDEIEEFSDITVTDEGEAQDQMNLAEELIDHYVGPQDRFFSHEKIGKATSGAAGYLIDTSGDTPLDVNDGYLSRCEVEIIGGTGIGQRRSIVSSTRSDKKISVAPNFTTPPDATSVYRIYQLAKFPRRDDYRILEDTYYKYIPEAVRRAVLAQLEYIIEKGSDFFSGATDYAEEWMLDYKYVAKQGVDRLISPTARHLLRGIMNRKGRIV